MATERNAPRAIIGTVVSDKMDKTITVRDERLVKHPLYGKYVRRQTRYKAHDERNEAREGDKVEIIPTRPMSKSKHYRLLRVVRKFGGVTGPVGDAEAGAEQEVSS
jgi:small subunit ribosomal protein S17